MNNNMQRLGDALSGRMKKTAGAFVPTTVELGVINSNMSLSTDGMLTPIPRGQYMVNLFLTGVSYITSTGGSHGGHVDPNAMASGQIPTMDAGTHNHSLSLRSLAAGDRVLVIWCGNEPVVVAIVKSS